MTDMEEGRTRREMEQHAMVLAEMNCEGLDVRCRRWRRCAVVRRCLCVAVLLAGTVYAVGRLTDTVMSQPWATGTLTTDKAVASVHETLMAR